MKPNDPAFMYDVIRSRSVCSSDWVLDSRPQRPSDSAASRVSCQSLFFIKSNHQLKLKGWNELIWVLEHISARWELPQRSKKLRVRTFPPSLFVVGWRSVYLDERQVFIPHANMDCSDVICSGKHNCCLCFRTCFTHEDGYVCTILSRSARQLESLDAHVVLDCENGVMTQLSEITWQTLETLWLSAQVSGATPVLKEFY